MENEGSIKKMINDSMQEIRQIMDADTVTGQPIKLENGVTIIPFSRVSLGFASGGIDMPAKKNKDKKTNERKNFGGAGGTGVTVNPIGFLVTYPDGKVEMLPVSGSEEVGPLEQIAEILHRAPEVVGRLRELFDEVDAVAKEQQ